MFKLFCRCYVWTVHVINHPLTSTLLDKVDDVFGLIQQLL